MFNAFALGMCTFNGSMFAVLAWSVVEMERVSGLATLRPDVVAAMHQSPFSYFASLSPQEVGRLRSVPHGYESHCCVRARCHMCHSFVVLIALSSLVGIYPTAELVWVERFQGCLEES